MLDDALGMVMWIILFFLLMASAFDVKQAARYKEEMKNALDMSTKAAIMQIDQTPTKIAQGIFEIDPVTSKTVFKDYLQDNIAGISNGNFSVYVADYQAINTHTAINYTDPISNKVYILNKPTFVAVMRFTYNGIFIKQSIELSTLAGSRISN
jgi:Flp pilus assembly protein TadG